MRNHGTSKLNLRRQTPAEVATAIATRILTRPGRDRIMVVVRPNGDVSYGNASQKGLVRDTLAQPDAEKWIVGRYHKTTPAEQLRTDLEEWLCQTAAP